MSEIDRLNNADLHPALPVADKRRRRENPGDQAPQDGSTENPNGAAATESAQAGTPRIPKSLVDEYA